MPRSRVSVLDLIDVGVGFCWSCTRLFFLWFLPSSSSFPSSFPFSGFCRACRGFFFVRLVAARGGRRVCFRSPSCFFVVSLVSAGAVGPLPCGCRLFSPCSWSSSLSPLVWFAPGCLSPSTHLYCYWWTSRRNCFCGHFYCISELRCARQEERFAQCSFRHLRQVVFHLAGSLGVFLRFAAPVPGGC